MDEACCKEEPNMTSFIELQLQMQEVIEEIEYQIAKIGTVVWRMVPGHCVEQDSENELLSENEYDNQFVILRKLRKDLALLENRAALLTALFPNESIPCNKSYR